MPSARTDDGVRLSYRIQGAGPLTLLFMHGWAGSGAYFDEVVGELDLNTIRVITMDLRGHGESDKPVSGGGLDRIAQDVWTVADAAGANRLVIAGFSMSGKFAQYVASCQPARVAGLVLIAGFPASEIPFSPDLARDWVARAGSRERFRELLAPFVSEPVDAMVFDRFLADAAKVPAAVLDETLQVCVGTSFVDRAKLLQMPTLVVGGRHDPIFTPEAVAYLAQTLPCARGVCLDCNHEIPMERPRDLAHVIEAFVAGLGVGC